jgi:hypothetical protein
VAPCNPGYSQVGSGSQCVYQPSYAYINIYNLSYDDEAVGNCETYCTGTVNCITAALKVDSVALTKTCTVYGQPFDGGSFSCSDATPLTIETDVYANGCPTTIQPGRRDLTYSPQKVKRKALYQPFMMKRQSSSNDTTTEADGSGFDAGSAAAEGSYVPTISDDSPYFGLPPFDENVAVAEAAGANGTSGNGTSTGSDTEIFITLYDSAKHIELVALDSGALTLGPYGGGTSFGALGPDIAIDIQGRYFVYSPDEIAKKGVSRLHVAGPKSIPKDSQIIVLVEVPTDGGNIYIAGDTSGNIFFLARCNIDFGNGPMPKVFLVKDYATGLSALADPSLLYTVIGGVVMGDCQALSLTSDIAPDVLSS